MLSGEVWGTLFPSPGKYIMAKPVSDLVQPHDLPFGPVKATLNVNLRDKALKSCSVGEFVLFNNGQYVK